MNRLVLIQSSVGKYECVVIDTQDLTKEKLLEEYGDEVCQVVQVIKLPELDLAWPIDRGLFTEEG